MANQGWSNTTARRLVVVEGSVYTGLFFYTPTAAAGNLVGSWTAQAGTDPYGNAYPAGINVTIGTISGVSFMGDDFVINPNGIFFYSGTPAAGNLLLALAPLAGNDEFGNHYAQGLSVNAGQFSIVLGETGGSPLILFNTNRGKTLSSSSIQTVLQGGVGNAQYEQIQVLGAEDSTQKDSVATSWSSSSPDGSQHATISHFYGDSTGTLRALEQIGYPGVVIYAGMVTAVEPGTGTSSSNPALPETWHNATFASAQWSNQSANQPVQYRMNPDGSVAVRGSATWTSNGTTGLVSGANLFTLPAAYAPTEAPADFPITPSGAVSSIDANRLPTAEVGSSGMVTIFHVVSVATNGTKVNVSVNFTFYP